MKKKRYWILVVLVALNVVGCAGRAYSPSFHQPCLPAPFQATNIFTTSPSYHPLANWPSYPSLTDSYSSSNPFGWQRKRKRESGRQPQPPLSDQERKPTLMAPARPY